MGMTVAGQQDALAKLRTQVNALTPELKNALPSHIKPEKFQRVIMTVVQQQEDLLLADRRTLFASVMKCAADGLIPDGREAALVIFNTKVKRDGREEWVKAVQYMPMLGGILKRIRNSGEIASVQAHVIYEHDQFLIRRGLTDTLEHTPLFPGERGKAIGAYAVAKFKDGSDPQFEVMDLNQINKVRSISKAKDGPTWTTHWDEMARKTVFRRLSKWLPMDAETETVMRRDDELNTIEHVTPGIDAAVGTDRQLPATSKLDALAYQDNDEAQTQYGEVLDAEPEPDEPNPIAGMVAHLATLTSNAAIDKWQQTEAAREAVKGLSKVDGDRWAEAVNNRRRAIASEAA